MNTENTQQQGQRARKLHNGQDDGQHQVVRCANCDIEILWTPTIARDAAYCCTGCAAGGPCTCDYSQYRSVNISGVIHYCPDAS